MIEHRIRTLLITFLNTSRLRLSTGSRCLALGLLVVFTCLPVPEASAQSRARLSDVDARLVRVENVLDQSILKLLQQIESMETNVRQLRGEIESLNNEIESLKRRNRELYRDTDRRISEIEQLGSSSDFPPLSDELAEQPLSNDSLEQQAVFVSPETPIPAPRKTPGTGPAPPSSPVGATTRAATAGEKAGYTKAYDLLARGDNAEAVKAFDEFLEQYPDGPYSDNAWYWQGEAKYAQRNFDDALYNFSVVVEYFPNSPKAPDSRLKIGYALYEQQRYGESKQVLTGVTDDYPGRSVAVLARKRLQQMTREGR